MHDQVTSEKLERIHAEIERLHGSIRSLDRDAKNSKHVLWLCLLAIPAYLLVGGLAATLVVLFTVALLATALYLVAVRRREYLGLINDCHRDIARLSGEPPRRA